MSIHAPRWRPPLESASKISLPRGKAGPRFATQPFGSSFRENLRELCKPAPRRVPDGVAFWKRGRGLNSSQVVALAVHVGLVILIFFPARHPPRVSELPASKAPIVPLDISEFSFKLPPGNDVSRGGGGGGTHSPLPATKGRLPKFAMTQLVPPSPPREKNPLLVAETSLIGPPDLQFPSPNLNSDGNPLAKMISDSSGPGGGGGIGNGDGTGLGNGYGPGLGPGGNGGWGGGLFKPGYNGVGYPTCVYCPDAKYPEEARKAKFQGVVQLQIVVSPDGRARDMQVVRGPGLGLDEQAVAAVKTWRFKPALGPNRVAVPTQIIIEVQFRLL
jgi:protein TonB